MIPTLVKILKDEKGQMSVSDGRPLTLVLFTYLPLLFIVHYLYPNWFILHAILLLLIGELYMILAVLFFAICKPLEYTIGSSDDHEVKEENKETSE